MKVIHDDGDNVTIRCDCGTVFYADATGINCIFEHGMLIPTCDNCGAKYVGTPNSKAASGKN